MDRLNCLGFGFHFLWKPGHMVDNSMIQIQATLLELTFFILVWPSAPPTVHQGHGEDDKNNHHSNGYNNAYRNTETNTHKHLT